MRAELKKKWVNALRSGKYKQGKHVLRNTVTDTYCCLGVLCDVTDSDLWEDGIWEGHAADVPSDMVHDYFQQIMIDMNDDYNKSFHEIATYIEENL